MMIIKNIHRAGFAIKSIRERFAQRVDATARPATRLKDRNVMARVCQFVSRRKTRQARADNRGE